MQYHSKSQNCCLQIRIRKLLQLLISNAWKVSKYGVFSGPYFPAFGLNTVRYPISLCIQSECRKILTRKISVFGQFSPVPDPGFYGFNSFLWVFIRLTGFNYIWNRNIALSINILESCYLVGCSGKQFCQWHCFRLNPNNLALKCTIDWQLLQQSKAATGGIL